jgi:hypothetical protein
MLIYERQENKGVGLSKTLLSQDNVCDDSFNRSSRDHVHHDILDLVNEANETFERDCILYREKSEWVQQQILERKCRYHHVFEMYAKEEHQCGGASYWVPTTWLKQWICGRHEDEDEQIPPSIDLCSINVMKTRQFLCLHSTPGAPKISPHWVASGHLKRVPEKMFELLLTSGKNMDVIIDVEVVLRCEESECHACKCEWSEVRNQEIVRYRQLWDVYYALTKKDDNTQEASDHVVCRDWLKAFKIFFRNIQKAENPVRLLSLNVPLSLNGENDIADSALKSSLPKTILLSLYKILHLNYNEDVNAKIACPHQKLVADTKMYSKVSMQAWNAIATAFSSSTPFFIDGEHTCMVCVHEKQEKKNMQGEDRRLFQLSQKRPTKQQAAAYYGEEFESTNSLSSSDFFLVETRWMQKWKRYVSILDYYPISMSHCFICRLKVIATLLPEKLIMPGLFAIMENLPLPHAFTISCNLCLFERVAALLHVMRSLLTMKKSPLNSM